MDNKNVFATNLNRYMQERKVSRNDLSEAIGVSYFTVTDWVKGKKYPRMDKVEMLAQYFCVNKSDLIENQEIINQQSLGNSPGELKLTEGEKMLVDIFRMIPEDKQQHFLEMGRLYADSLKKD